MTTYILRRLLLVPVTLFIVSFGTAMIMRLTPADVVDYRLQNSYNPERADALREQLGLNKGPFEAYYDWISNAFQGDFGRSFISYTPIVDEVKRRFPVTIQLVLLTVHRAGLYRDPVRGAGGGETKRAHGPLRSASSA